MFQKAIEFALVFQGGKVIRCVALLPLIVIAYLWTIHSPHSRVIFRSRRVHLQRPCQGTDGMWDGRL